MVEIEQFKAEMLCGRDTLLLGSSERKKATVAAVIDEWPASCPETALIVFDHGGDLYERFAGDALLIDLSSEDSLIPDVTEPFVLNEDIGVSSENIAYAVRQAIYQEIRSRDANDKFFDDLGKLVTDRMLTYMLETAKNVVHNLAFASSEEGSGGVARTLDRINLFSIFCRQHRYIETLMTKIIGGESDVLPVKYRIAEEENSGRPLTRELALAKYILTRELRFQKNGDREAPVPFADLLMTNGDNTNTQRCIKMQADASTSDFRALVAMITDNTALFSGNRTLKLESYLKAPAGRPLFISGSGNAAADRGLAPLLTAAAGAAARNTKSAAVVLMPEIDRWGVFNYLDKFRQNWERLSFTFGYDNFFRLSLESRTDEERLIDTLYSSSVQRIWHASEEERICKAFDTYVSEADVTYSPEDLDSEIRAIEREGHVSYASLQEPPERHSVRRRVRLRRKSGGSKLWITSGAKKSGKLTLESLLEEGDTL